MRTPARRVVGSRWWIAAAAAAALVGCQRLDGEPPAATGPLPAVHRVLEMDGIQNAYPRWSADGSRILFQSNRSGDWRLYVMNADGSAQSELPIGDGDAYMADWSPDNSRVAFVSTRRGGDEDVFVMAMDGSGLANLTNSRGSDVHPYWTPDGSRILFNSGRDDPRNRDVWSVTPDGSQLRRITDYELEETCARISPDGNQMVMLVNDDENSELHVVDAAAGDHRRNLSRTPWSEGWPSWLPDGRILYSSDDSGRMSLATMKGDGSDRRLLSAPPEGWYDARAVASPDGRKVVFNRQKGATLAIYTLELPPG